MFHRLLLTSLLLACVTESAIARDLPTARPASVGMSAERLQRVTDMATRYVEQNKLAGVVTMVARRGKLVHFEAVGQRGVKDKRPLRKDDLFRIYSMTKPITAVAALQLYEQGKFQLDDPIAKFVPELSELEVLTADGERVPAESPITMHQLLTHTAGFSYGFDPQDPVDQLYRAAAAEKVADLDAYVAALAKLPLKHQPGTTWHYSVAVDVTGAIVERLSGEPFDEYLENHIFKPLGMTDTFFSVPDAKLDRFLPNHGWDPKSQALVTLGEDAIANFRNVTLFSGGGGLVSTAMDYMRFAEMLRNGGSYHGKRLLSSKTVEYMTRNHLPATVTATGTGERPTVSDRSLDGFGFGLGVGVITDPTATAVMGSEGEYFWGGAAGTVFWIDPVEDIVAIAMIQLMGSPWKLREHLKVAVNQSIVD